uniref:Uncharacterized protein n=1 Tax=Kalanchoe fedtschenkoi TaxID=63787 RepID=A0A7N0RF40_KALFE
MEWCYDGVALEKYVSSHSIAQEIRKELLLNLKLSENQGDTFCPISEQFLLQDNGLSCLNASTNHNGYRRPVRPDLAQFRRIKTFSSLLVLTQHVLLTNGKLVPQVVEPEGKFLAELFNWIGRWSGSKAHSASNVELGGEPFVHKQGFCRRL